MTIKDLSAQTGYSVGTISRVLNNHPNVSEKARAVILKAVSESGFQLNANAKQLKQQHGNCILVVVKGTNNELFSQLVEAIQAHYASSKYPVVVDYQDEDDNEAARGAQLWKEKKPLGIFFLGGNQENFRDSFSQIDVPCVLVTNSAASWNLPNLSSVSIDDMDACTDAMDALVKLGHRQIAIVGGYLEHSDTSRLRFNGCLRSLRRHGIPFDEKKDYVDGKYSYQDGYQGIQRLLENGRKFSAVFAVADVVAIGVIRALWDNGLRVPEDVSVIGFDGLRLGDYLVPRLSSIHQSIPLLAQRSVEIMTDCIENGAAARHETVPYAIDLRESTRYKQE